jgi:oxygen-dependent protoporphyrinogen oxidase
MGDAVVRQFVDPVVSGVHAVSADAVDADAVAPGLRDAVQREGSLAGAVAAIRGRAGVAGAPVRGLPGGMTGLVRALADASRQCGVDVREQSRVTAVRPNGEGWEIDTSTGVHTVDRVLLAVPVVTAAELLGRARPDIATLLRGVPLGSVVVVALRLDAPGLDAAPVGSGALVSREVSGIAAKGMTHASAKWQWIRDALPPGEHVVRLSYGRDGEDPWSVAGGDPLHRALADVRAITGVDDLRPIAHHVQSWPRSLSHPLPGQSAWRERVRTALPPGLVAIGPGLSGNGIAGAVAEVTSVLT